MPVYYSPFLVDFGSTPAGARKMPKSLYPPFKVFVRWFLVSWSLGKAIILRNYVWQVVFEQFGFWCIALRALIRVLLGPGQKLQALSRLPTLPLPTPETPHSPLETILTLAWPHPTSRQGRQSHHSSHARAGVHSITGCSHLQFRHLAMGSGRAGPQ